MKRSVLALVGGVGLGIGLVIGGGAVFVATRSGPAVDQASADPSHGEHGHEEHAEGVVDFPREKWVPAGLEIEPARKADLQVIRTATGKVTANEDRLAHIFSLAEGVVHEVAVRYGDRVKTGDTLAVIDSREVGQAKLALVQAPRTFASPRSRPSGPEPLPRTSRP